MGFRFANIAGRSALVDADGGYHDLAQLTGGAVPSEPMRALADAAALHAAADLLEGHAADGTLRDAEIDAPVPAPRNVFAVGLNYADHAAESSLELPENPLVFTKFPSCIVGPDSVIELRSDFADYEIELVVVIGAGGRDIAPEDAWNHVLGLTAGQDISDRALQFAAKPPHFDLGKSRDTYGPLGPALVSVDLFEDPTDLGISCSVNGEVRQESRTSKLIFSVADLIAYLSSVLTLEAGDIIFTGTPAGVGATSGQFLKAGDVVTAAVEGIGHLTNVCV